MILGAIPLCPSEVTEQKEIALTQMPTDNE